MSSLAMLRKQADSLRLVVLRNTQSATNKFVVATRDADPQSLGNTEVVVRCKTLDEVSKSLDAYAFAIDVASNRFPTE